MAKEPVRNAALAAGGGFVGLAAVQAALALAPPWGRIVGRGPRGEAPVGPAHRQRRRSRLSCASRADRAGARRVPGRAIIGGRPPLGNVGARRPAVGGGGPELRLVAQVGALRVGTRDADPGSPVPLRGAQGRAGFGGRLKGADVLVRSFGPLFAQVRVRLVFSEVWPGGAQRSSRSTCRTDRAELYPRIYLSVDAPPPVPQYYRQGNPMKGESRWES